MTILVAFHDAHARDFKYFYRHAVCRHWRPEFPALVSYNRFVELIPSVLVPLIAYLNTRFATTRGLAFIDSIPVAVCHKARSTTHRVFRGAAAWGKSSVDWYFGFKLHLIINDCGDLLALKLTPGNVDDRTPVQELAAGLFGKLFGDKGYISQALFEQLWEQGVHLITRLKRNMKQKLMPLVDRLLLGKRTLIESVGERLKRGCYLEHSRHRSRTNGLVNMMAALVAYTWQESRPTLGLTEEELASLQDLLH